MTQLKFGLMLSQEPAGIARAAHKALTVARARGILGLVRAVEHSVTERYARWQEDRFDRRYGVDTRGIEDDLASLGATGEHLPDAYGYEPVRATVFRAIMRALAIDPLRYVFVDFGSGKGRALLLAAQYGFRRVIGVELAPRLHEIARRNVQAFQHRVPRASPIELHCGDAAGLAIPDADTLLCFYNPFGARVLGKVAANIEQSYRRLPRNLAIAYRNPMHPDAFEQLPFLRRTVRNESFAVYRTRGFHEPKFDGCQLSPGRKPVPSGRGARFESCLKQ